jgi:prevent-host-death family protein
MIERFDMVVMVRYTISGDFMTKTTNKPKGKEMQDVSADYLRKHLGEVLDRSYYTGAEVKITKKGKNVGVFVPMELYEKRRKVYREAFLRFMEEQAATGRGGELTEDEVMEDAVQAINEVRKLSQEQDD